MNTTAPMTTCVAFRPLTDQDVCADCRWNRAAHLADSSEPAATLDGVTTQVLKRAAVHTPGTSGMVLDTSLILELQGTVRERRASLRAQLATPRPANRGARAYDYQVEECEHRRDYALFALNQAIRFANPGATEAQINAASASLA